MNQLKSILLRKLKIRYYNRKYIVVERGNQIMKIHYFQRYHSKENVDTANTMLLLSRLYSYSPDKFFIFLKEYILPQNIEPQLTFKLQEKSLNSVPDATISQPSFKIVVETKLHGQFSVKQLLNHLGSFKNEDYKILVSLNPEQMKATIKADFEKELKNYNNKNNTAIYHRNLTFETIIESLRNVVAEQDYEMLDVLNDYEEYCIEANLIPNSWQRMRVQLAGTTINFNKNQNLYYDSIDRGFSGHEYLGLYNNKSVRAIGKITDIIVAEKKNNQLEFTIEKGELTEEMKKKINDAIIDGLNYGYMLEHNRYFFVDKFYDTDFKKVTPYAPRGSRMFDLTEVLEIDTLPETQQIADLLKKATWE